VKKERIELSIELKGRTYKGYRIIEYQNDGVMTQLIHYKMQHSRKDVRSYKPGHEKIMENVARSIFEDLVREEKEGK
jgi:hypothetical protein